MKDSINLEKLKDFILASNNAGYASADLELEKGESDHSSSIRFQQGDFSSHDNYFGGEPYGGRWIVFYKEQPVWIMVYYGWVNSDTLDSNEVYKFLQKALSHMPNDKPFRGPDQFSENDYHYLNEVFGNLENYSGEEVIKKEGNEIYRAKYLGGMVDRR